MYEIGTRTKNMRSNFINVISQNLHSLLNILTIVIYSQPTDCLLERIYIHASLSNKVHFGYDIKARINSFLNEVLKLLYCHYILWDMISVKVEYRDRRIQRQSNIYEQLGISEIKIKFAFYIQLSDCNIRPCKARKDFSALSSIGEKK